MTRKRDSFVKIHKRFILCICTNRDVWEFRLEIQIRSMTYNVPQTQNIRRRSFLLAGDDDAEFPTIFHFRVLHD